MPSPGPGTGHQWSPLLNTAHLGSRRQEWLELLSPTVSGWEQTSLCDAGSWGAFHITCEVFEPAAVPAAHLSLPSFFGGGDFSLPCCLFSLPPPPAGPFGRWQMGMNVTLATSLPVLCLGPAEKSSRSRSLWGLQTQADGGSECGCGKQRGLSTPDTPLASSSGQPATRLIHCLGLLPPFVPTWL